MSEVIEWKSPESDESQLKRQLRGRPGEWALIRKNYTGLDWNMNLNLELREIRSDPTFETKVKQAESLFLCDIYARYIG